VLDGVPGDWPPLLGYNQVTPKPAAQSAGVAFSGLVTYSALNHAAEIIAERISAVLGGPAQVRPGSGTP